MKLPIRIRITAWYVCLLALIVIAVGAFLVLRLRADLIGAIDDGLRPAAAQIAHDYRLEGLPEFRDSAGTVLKGERASAQLLAPDGSILTAFGDPVGNDPMLGAADRAAALDGRPVTVTRALGVPRQAFRLTARRVERKGEAQVVVAGQSLQPVQASVRRVVVLLLLACPAALLATAAGGWWLARRALRPIAQITRSAESIGVDRLEERVVQPRTHDEVAYLARTLNTMLDRIQVGVEEQRRLVADASHELRTPLAAMRAELDVTLRTDAHGPAARAVLLSTREEVDRMSRTVDGLLTLATVDEGLVLAPEPLELGPLAGAVIHGLRNVAEAAGVRVEQRHQPALVLADDQRLRQALRNVIENAIKFSPPGGTVTVTTERDGSTGRVAVEDEGPGIPEGDRRRVFDRFYRADPARTRATGGSGLGLAITRELVTAHGGAVWARDGARGALVVIALPALAEQPMREVTLG